MLPMLPLLLILGQGQVPADAPEASEITQESISETRRAFRERAMMGTNEAVTGDLIHGAFANDPNLCIAAFSSQYHPVSISDYLIETRYSGASVTYIFYSLDVIDDFYDDEDRTAPVAQPFSCARRADQGSTMLVRILE